MRINLVICSSCILWVFKVSQRDCHQHECLACKDDADADTSGAVWIWKSLRSECSMWVRDMGRSILLHECSMSIAHKLHTEDQYKSPRQQMCGEQNVETTPHPQTSFFKELWQMSVQFSPNGFQIDFCTNWGWIYFLLNGPHRKNYISQWGLLRCNRTIKPIIFLHWGIKFLWRYLLTSSEIVYHVRNSRSIKKEKFNYFHLWWSSCCSC